MAQELELSQVQVQELELVTFYILDDHYQYICQYTLVYFYLSFPYILLTFFYAPLR